MWLQKELINKNYMELAPRAHNRKGVGHLRAGQPERAADVLRLRAQPAETNALQNGMRKKAAS